MEKIKVDTNERDLIEAIRNYRKSMHNPSYDLEEYAIRLFEKLMYEKQSTTSTSQNG
jgi:hypothetical protein